MILQFLLQLLTNTSPWRSTACILVLLGRGKGNSFDHLPTPFAFLCERSTKSVLLPENSAVFYCSLRYLFLLSAVPPPEKVGGPCNFTPQASRKCCSIPEGAGGQNRKAKLNEGENLLCKFDVKVEGWDRTDAASDKI